jgi:hypothetical protein
MSQTNGWTEERRRKQSELIQTWKPWEQSTGPKTKEGKNKSSQNAYKGAVRPLIRQLGRLLREQEDVLEHL